MKFIVLGDLHGKIPKIFYKDYDAIISTGDVCSSDALRKYKFMALRDKLKNPNSKLTWYEIAGMPLARKLIKESFEDGRKVLKELDSKGVPVFIVPGNADMAENSKNIVKECNYKNLIKGFENITDVYDSIVNAEDFQIIGYGITSGPEYPQYKEDILMKKGKLGKIKSDYDKSFRRYSKLFRKSTKPVIFLSHNVPFKTSLDRIINIESPRYGQHYGSILVRRIVEKYQPFVCIGGHMHDSKGKTKIGKTVCINAGYDTIMLLEIDGKKLNIKS